MDIDIRKIIVNTLFTISTKTDRKTITWDDMAKYIYMLEKKFNTKINLVYTNDFNAKLYERVIAIQVSKDNIYFKVNPKLINFKFSKNLIDIGLLLSKKSNERLIEYDTTLKNIPNIKSINFINLFKLFMLIYIKKYSNNIDINKFWNIMTNIINVLNRCGIEVKYATKLELFRIVYMYDKCQKFNLKDGNINSDAINIEEFEKEATCYLDKDILCFLNRIIEYHLIGMDEQKLDKSKIITTPKRCGM